MPVLIVCAVMAWVVVKGFEEVGRRTRGEVENWWGRAETRARKLRRQRSSAAGRLLGAAAGAGLWTGRVGYRLGRFGVGAFAAGVRDGWATRDRAAAKVRDWRDRRRNRRAGRTDTHPGGKGAHRRPATPTPGDGSKPAGTGPQPGPPPSSGPEGRSGAADDSPAPPKPTAPDPDTPPPFETRVAPETGDASNPPISSQGPVGSSDPDQARPQPGAPLDADFIVEFLDPEPGDLDGLRPADVSYRLHPQHPLGALMTTPQPPVGVGDITGIDSTRIQLSAVSQVLTAVSTAVENMQAGLSQYQMDETTLGEIAQLVDNVQATSQEATGVLNNLNTRHGGVEDAIKSAPVKAAQTQFYEE